MERVDGPTLRVWLNESQPQWRAVRDLFVQAAQGLEAAHAAAIVHRDFKLDNVIVGTDGRVRVTDFGLARQAAVWESHPEENDPAPPSQSSVAAEPTTLTGTLLGTPGYIAPELRDGGQADGRSDQYSFCVALHEALYGIRPDQQPAPKPKPKTIPRWFAAALERGLSSNPHERHASMAALCIALTQDQRKRRKRAIAGLILAISIPVFTLAVAMTWRQGLLCNGAAEQMATSWNPSVGMQIEQVFAAHQDAAIDSIRPRVVAALDEFANQWTAQHTETCEAARVRGERSEQLMDRQMSCLEVRRRELGELVNLLTAADVELALNAIHSVEELASLATCSRIDLLEARAPEPNDPILLSKLDDARQKLAEAKALRLAARDSQARPLALEAVELARQSHWSPISARALLLLGRIDTKLGDYERAENTLYEALWAAQRGADGLLEANAWSSLLWVEAYHRGNHERTDRLVSHARAALARAGGDVALETEVADHLGVLRWRQGRYAEAAEQHELALRLRSDTDSTNHRAISRALINLGIVRKSQGRYSEAADLYRRSLALKRRTLGPEHPSIARALNGLANTLFAIGQVNNALARHREALRLLADRYGEDHPLVAVALNNVGTDLMELGDFDEARSSFQRALAINQAKLGAQHTRIGTPLANLGELALHRGDPQSALVFYQRALKIWQAAHGDGHLRAAIALTGVGRAHSEMGATKRALELLERAWAIVKDRETEPSIRADAAFALARARQSQGRNGSRDLGLEALRALRQGSPSVAKRLAKVDKWLRSHGRER